MIIMTVKLKSALSHDDLVVVMEERAPEYRALPGLIQKYYGHEKDTGAYTGVLLWESREAMLAFRESELAKTTATAYQATEQPRVEIFDLMMALRPAEVATTAP